MSERHKSVVLNLAMGLLALLLGGVVFGGLASMRKPPARRPVPEKIYNVEVVAIEPLDLQEIVSGFGTARAEHDVQYSAEVAGVVRSISPRLKVGEHVTGPGFVDASAAQELNGVQQYQQTSGELLLSIDPDSYQQRLVQADAGIAEAQAEESRLAQEEKNAQRLLEKAERDFDESRKEHDRMEMLARDGTVTQSQVTASLLEMRRYEQMRIETQNVMSLFPDRRAQVQTRLLRLGAERRLAAIDVARTEVRAPFSGVLSEVSVEKGQYVQPGTSLFRVTNIDRIEIAVPLHPLDFATLAALIRAGEQPRVELAENEQIHARWTGRVVRLSPQADRKTRTIDVFVEVDNRGAALPLLPGLFVQTSIGGPLINDAAIVPREAIVWNNPQSGRVYVADNGRVREVAVQIARRLEGIAFLVEPLPAGTEVIVTNLDVLKEGSAVSVQTVTSLDGYVAKQRSIVGVNRAAGRPLH